MPEYNVHDDSIAGWLNQKLSELFGGIHKRWDDHNKNTHKDTVYFIANGKTDSNGNVEFPIGGRVPDGRLLITERIVQWADGKTPASVDKTGWTGIFHSKGQGIGSLADYTPRVTGDQVFPSIAEFNHNDAPRFRGGEQIWFACNGCIASTNVSVVVQGCMEVEGYRS